MDTYSLASTKVSDQDLEQRGLKRKRVLSIYGLKDKKSVRFDLEHCQVAYTYSPAEYDRGGLRRPLTLYRPNPALSLSIPPPTLNNGDDSPASSASPETPPNTSTFRIPPPKLSIDTSLCAGPLIFTNMSTTYIGDDDSTTEDFLVPLSV